MPEALQIFVLRNGQLVQSEVFAEGLYTVGRAVDSDLRLDEDGVEPVHALLEFANGEVRLSEHDGGSGLVVNGERVSTAAVRSGDDVRVGPFVLKTRLLGRKTVPPPARAAAPQPSTAPVAPAPAAPHPVARPPAPATAAPPRPSAPPPRIPTPAPARPGAPQLRPVAPLRPAPPPLAPQPRPTPAPAPVQQSAAPRLTAPPDADLDELDQLFDAAVSGTHVPVAVEEPEVLDPEEAGMLLRPVQPEPPAPPQRPAPPEKPAPPLRRSPPAAAAPAPLVTVERRAPTGSMLLASIFWGDTLVHARTFPEGKPVFADAAGKAALQLYGFPNPPRVRTRGASWTVAAPPGAQAQLRSGQAWTAAPSASKELLLKVGETLRLTQGRFHLELSAQSAPRQAKAMFWRNLDKQMAAVLLLTAISLITFLNRLPPPPPERAHEVQLEAIRHVRASIEEKKKEKPKPPPPPPSDTPEKSPDKTVAKATTLRQAGAPIRSLQKISKATSGLGNLLAKLGPAMGIKGGSPTALPLVPTVGAAPAPLPGLGGTGPGGSIGPITKGTEILRGGVGLLGSATAGRGAVGGVPVSIPSRPTALKGSIDRDLVAKVINEHVNEMRSCYERALIREPNLGAGKVLLEWTIDLQGGVSEVRSKSSTLKNDDVVSCLLDVARQMKFPKPAGGIVIVTFPILFNSVGY